MRVKKELADDAEATQLRMDSANALLSALAGEEARWTAQSAAFSATIERLTGAWICVLCRFKSRKIVPFGPAQPAWW